jgi:peptidoglycan hydrolase-like protein with peptidoglycan-binding domain
MNDKEQFIADLYPAASKVSQQTGMSMELILAQAALETGWGEKVLPGTHNIFNIKASPDWHGPTKTFIVPEFEHGTDRVKFLQENSRYAKAGLFDEGTRGNLEKEANALQKAGYATDPKYAEQLAVVYKSPMMQQAIKHAQEHGLEQTSARPAKPSQIASFAPHPCILEQGDHGLAVHKLQNELSQLGYKDGHGHPLKADSDFGLDTRHAVEKFQHDHGLVEDGKVGPATEKALDAQTKKHAEVPGLDHPKNPDHALYAQALAGVHKLDVQAGRPSDQHSANLAAALVVDAKKEGLTRIDVVALSTDGGSRVFAVQNSSPMPKFAEVPTLPSLNAPIEQSSAAVQQITQQQAAQPMTSQPPQVSAPAQPAQGMSR